MHIVAGAVYPLLRREEGERPGARPDTLPSAAGACLLVSSVRGDTMDKREINPTDWLLGFNINHGIEITGAQRVLYLSGQTANAADGAPMHAGDIVAQFQLAWDNLKAALAAADMGPSNIVRMNMYTTDVGAFMAAAEHLVPIFAGDGCKPVSTLLEVAALFEPELMIELEATAVA